MLTNEVCCCESLQSHYIPEKGYIEVHERRGVDGKFYNTPIMISVSDIVSLQPADALISGCYITVRGRKNAFLVSEDYQEVRKMVREAIEEKKPEKKEEVYPKPYHKDKFINSYGVKFVVVERATQIWYGVLCRNIDPDYYICVEMKKCGESLYPYMSSRIREIKVSDVEN